ncbi:GDSL esterase/lipase At5g55050-like [Fagus crenata]
MFTYSQAQKVAAMFTFGDSLVDVGNNNYLKLSLNKADFPHYGLNFPNKISTGRFSNGKNAADFLAEKVGHSSFQTGVSFCFWRCCNHGNDERYYYQSVPLTEQIDYFSTLYEEMKQQLGASFVQDLLSKSLFPIVIGGNDIFAYFLSSTLQKKITPTTIYIEKEECHAEMNIWSAKYNDGLKLMLQKLQDEFKDINYSYFDTFSIFSNLIQNPASYVKTACCGLGHLRAEIRCQPLAAYCSNRNDHFFWDAYHPTEASAHIIVDNMYHMGIQTIHFQ